MIPHTARIVLYLEFKLFFISSLKRFLLIYSMTVWVIIKYMSHIIHHTLAAEVVTGKTEWCIQCTMRVYIWVAFLQTSADSLERLGGVVGESYVAVLYLWRRTCRGHKTVSVGQWQWQRQTDSAVVTVATAVVQQPVMDLIHLGKVVVAALFCSRKWKSSLFE